MNDAVEAAARLIRKGDSTQREYCFFYPKSVLREGLKNAGESFGCLTYMEDDYWLTVVGEKIAIDNLEEVRCVVLSDEYGYGRTLKAALQRVDIAVEQFKKWSDDYVLGFIEGVAGHADLGWFGALSKHPRVLGILDGANSARRYVEERG